MSVCGTVCREREMSDDLFAEWAEGIRKGGRTRELVYEFWTEENRNKLGNGQAGIALYEELLAIVRRSGSEEAVKEFQKRFVPMLDQKLLQRQVMSAFTGALDDRIEVLHDRIRKGGEDGMKVFM